jgi:hypothetical protein
VPATHWYCVGGLCPPLSDEPEDPADCKRGASSASAVHVVTGGVGGARPMVVQPSASLVCLGCLGCLVGLVCLAWRERLALGGGKGLDDGGAAKLQRGEAGGPLWGTLWGTLLRVSP